MPTTMNDLATKTFDYLLETGHPERRLALRDLTALGAFSTIFEEDTRYYIDQYLNDNPQKFCADGISKFRKAILDPPIKVNRLTVMLEFEVEGANETFGTNSGADQGVVYDLVHHHLEGLSVLNGKVTLRNVDFSDYNASRK